MNRIRISSSTALALAALAVVALVASPALAGALRPADPIAPAPAATDQGSSNTITVLGTGTVTLTPDTATVIVGVSQRASTAAAAQSEAANAMTAILTAVKKHGIPNSDLATVDVGLSPVYDYSGDTQKLVGFQANQSLQVTVTNLADTGSIIDDAVAAGANSVQGISFSVNDPTAATAQARAAAVADAKTRAKELAQAAGVTLGPAVSITEVSAPAPVPVMAEAAPLAKGASTPVVPGTTQVTVQVQIAFALQ
jgi:uncharacterized protein